MSGEQKLNSYAIASIVFGVLGIILLPVWIIGFFGVAAGEKFRRLNRAANGKLKGARLALIGTILGMIPFLLMITRGILSGLTQ